MDSKITQRFRFSIIAVILISLFIVNCSVSPKFRKNRLPTTASKPEYTVKAPGDLMNAPSLRTYNGLASWYGPKFHGRKTANGETYDMYKISAAHKELPFNTWIRVTNKKNGKKLLVRINDRGPFIKGRILDLSYGAALQLETIRDGVVDVKIEVVKWGGSGRIPFSINP